MTALESIDSAMADPDFRHYVSIYDRYGAVRAYLRVRYPGHEESLDYSHYATEEANLYTGLAISRKIDEALELEEEMR